MKLTKLVLILMAVMALAGPSVFASPKALQAVSLYPNPFSPYSGGLNIDYTIASDYSQVFVTIKIMNISGELIRVLADNELRYTGTGITEKWDGRDKNGKYAANGRYLVQVELRDASGKRQHIFMAALVK